MSVRHTWFLPFALNPRIAASFLPGAAGPGSKFAKSSTGPRLLIGVGN